MLILKVDAFKHMNFRTITPKLITIMLCLALNGISQLSYMALGNDVDTRSLSEKDLETPAIYGEDATAQAHSVDLTDIGDDSSYCYHNNSATTDDLETFNRAVFGFNDVFDKVLLKPIAKIYEFLIPEWGRDRVRSFLFNLHEPAYIVNYILQGDPENAVTSMGRFVTNTSVGLLGLFDIASSADLSPNPTDFGLTLKKAGIGTGPYLVLPIIGPSSFRDAPALVIDIFMDPWGYYKFKPSRHHRRTYNTVTIARYSLEIIDKRQRTLKVLDQIEKTSLDKYATIKSIYLQKR